MDAALYMSIQRIIYICLMLSLSVWPSGHVLAQPDLLTLLKEQAIGFLSNKQPEQAYQVLKPSELTYAGDAQYNYLLGIAAIDSGHPEDASWAFERVVAVMPHHAGARMDMARAFFQLKDYEKAKKEFQILQGMSPPESAAKAIDYYLAEINRITEKKPVWLFSGQVYGAVGHDSNVNGAPTSDKILPAPWMQLFLTVLGSPDGSITTDQEKASAYFEWGAAHKVTYKRPEEWSFWGQIKAKGKHLQSHSEFSSKTLEFTSGMLWSKGVHSINSEIGLTQAWRDTTLNNKALSVQSSYSYAFNPRALLGGYLSVADQQYLESSSSNGILSTIGLTGSYIWGQYRPVVLQGNLYSGQDQASNARAEGDKVLYGGRVGLQFIYNQQHAFNTSLAWSTSRYAEQNSIFEKTRTEQQLSYGIGYTWTVNKLFSVKAQFNQSETRSNIELYESKKNEFYLRADYLY